MHVHFLVRHLEVLHHCHGDDGKCLIYLEQVHLGDLPADDVKQFLDSADRSQREPFGWREAA